MTSRALFSTLLVASLARCTNIPTLTETAPSERRGPRPRLCGPSTTELSVRVLGVGLREREICLPSAGHVTLLDVLATVERDVTRIGALFGPGDEEYILPRDLAALRMVHMRDGDLVGLEYVPPLDMKPRVYDCPSSGFAFSRFDPPSVSAVDTLRRALVGATPVCGMIVFEESRVPGALPSWECTARTSDVAGAEAALAQPGTVGVAIVRCGLPPGRVGVCGEVLGPATHAPDDPISAAVEIGNPSAGFALVIQTSRDGVPTLPVFGTTPVAGDFVLMTPRTPRCERFTGVDWPREL